MRNHGLVDRDTVKFLGYNSRLDTFQAVVGNWLIPKTRLITQQRIENANKAIEVFERECGESTLVTDLLRYQDTK